MCSLGLFSEEKLPEFDLKERRRAGLSALFCIQAKYSGVQLTPNA